MQDTPGNPNLSKAKPRRPETRDERLKAALKANMARRKAQGKARAEDQAKLRADNDKEDE